MAEPIAPEQALARCSDALRAGRLHDLAALVPVLQQALESLPIDDPTRFVRLQKQAHHMSGQLTAAMCGLRAARRRLEDIRKLDAGYLSYDNTGRLDVSPRRPWLTRRV